MQHTYLLPTVYVMFTAIVTSRQPTSDCENTDTNVRATEMRNMCIYLDGVISRLFCFVSVARVNMLNFVVAITNILYSLAL